MAWAAANGVPEDIFWKPIEIALGAHSKATTWETMSEAFAIFYCLWFSKHEVGKKDGLSITQGSLKSERCERTMENAVKNYLVMVDFDSGQTLDEIEAEVAKRGLFCIIYTTHSHMKAVSEIKQKALSEFLSKSEQSLANDDTNELIEQTRAYLSQVKKYHARVLETVTVSKRSIEGADCTYCISHSPMARARAVFVLDEPFDFTSRNACVEEVPIGSGANVTKAGAAKRSDCLGIRSAPTPRISCIFRVMPTVRRTKLELFLAVHCASMRCRGSKPKIRLEQSRSRSATNPPRQLVPHRRGRRLSHCKSHEVHSPSWQRL